MLATRRRRYTRAASMPAPITTAPAHAATTPMMRAPLLMPEARTPARAGAAEADEGREGDGVSLPVDDVEGEEEEERERVGVAVMV